MRKMICKNCGREFFVKKPKLYCSKSCIKEMLHKRLEESQTLCWRCENACGGCEWSAFLTPVDGWSARETKVKNKQGGDTYSSYHVYSCPKFVPDKRSEGVCSGK